MGLPAYVVQLSEAVIPGNFAVSDIFRIHVVFRN